MAKFAAYTLARNGAATAVVPWAIAGARAVGDIVDEHHASNFKSEHVGDYDGALFWGFVTACQTILKKFRQANKPVVYLDLAYWQRHLYYKVCVNARHPNAYFQLISHSDERLRKFKLRPAPFTPYQKEFILLAGMSEKAAWVEGYKMGEWENMIAIQLRAVTERPIIYRPKRVGAPPITATTGYCDPKTSLQEAFTNTYAVVTHHSNVAVDGLIAGVPCFVWDGAAEPLGLNDFTLIETPYYPPELMRYQWLCDLAYCQWSSNELRDGTCWRHLKTDGLIP